MASCVSVSAGERLVRRQPQAEKSALLEVTLEIRRQVHPATSLGVAVRDWNGIKRHFCIPQKVAFPLGDFFRASDAWGCGDLRFSASGGWTRRR